MLGVGSGGGHDALTRVRSGVAELQRETSAAVVVGALGPKMAQLAGEVADGVLLNWMTSEYLAITPTDDLDDLQELLRACAPDRA